MATIARPASFFGSRPPLRSLEAYADFLAARNGGSAEALAFDRREARLARLDASDALYSGPLDPAAVHRGYRRFKGEELPPELVALLAFVKINAAEAYGVEVAEAVRGAAMADGTLAGHLERCLLDEESYHTRILLGATRCFDGVAFEGASRPPIPLRAFLQMIPRLPTPLFHPLVLASELAGVYVFTWMLERLGSLFARDPEVRDVLEQRLIEVLIDEVGHVTFNRVVVGRLGGWVARALAATVLHALPSQVPEVIALGLDPWDLRDFHAFDVARLPREVRERAFLA